MKAAVLCLVLVLGACGAAEIAENDDLLSGRWQVTELSMAGEQLEADQFVLELSTAQASIRVDSNCHQLYGSFTFRENGTASFTVPGASTNECSASDQMVEEALVMTLESVTRWRQEGQKLVFEGQSSLLELTPLG